MAGGPLQGVRVLDLTRVWAGPLAARVLADLGADTIKIEAPLGRGPANVPSAQRSALGLSGGSVDRPWNQQGSFNKLNRNRRGLVLDLKAEPGHTLFLRLVAESDVVIENFSARAMPSLGLGYEQLREANPRIIYVTMPGFGTSGPYRDYVAYGPSVEGMTGLPALMGYGDGVPRVSSVGTPDPIVGMHAAAAVVTALQRRARTGASQFVDVSLHESAISELGEYFIEHQLTGHAPPVVANGHRRYAPHGTYRCRGEDDWIVIAARSDEEWAALCRVAGRGWERDPRFATMDVRREHRSTLDAAIAEWAVPQDKLELMHALQAVGVPAGAVLNAPELVADRHLNTRGFFVELYQPDVGPIRYPGTPVVLDGARAQDWTPAPTLGQHNEEVLGELLGLDADEIASLYERGVIANRPPA